VSWAFEAEQRAIALLRSRAILVGVTAAASLAMAAAFGFALHPDDRREAMYQVLGYGAFLMPLLVGHGMISGDLRSGVAMLWLQKPVRPVLFFQVRALEVSALSLALVAAVLGGGASIVALAAGLGAARELLSSVPSALLAATCLCALLFGFSGWGARTDSLFVVVFVVATALWMATGQPVSDLVAWIALPVDALSAVGSFLAGRPEEDVGKSALLVGRFLVLWAAIGTVGLLVTTWSPLPKEASR
jgi:hypothetical protein